MIRLRTHSAEETADVAAAVAAVAVPGDLLILVGGLGAGKTAFVQGFGRALGVTGPITSPTFTLANRYEGEIEVNHLDVYRLEQLEEVQELGLHELIDGEGVTLVEWGDAIAPVLGADHLEVRLALGDEDDERTIELTPSGRWTARARRLAEQVAPWQEGETPC